MKTREKIRFLFFSLGIMVIIITFSMELFISGSINNDENPLGQEPYKNLVRYSIFLCMLIAPSYINKNQNKFSFSETLLSIMIWILLSYHFKKYSASYLDWVCMSVILLIAHLVMHYAFSHLKVNEKRFMIFFKLASIIVSINLLFGIVYYSIYISNESSFKCIITDASEKAKNIIDLNSKKIFDYQIKKIGLIITQSILSNNEIKAKRSGYNSVEYIIKDNKSPFLETRMNRFPSLDVNSPTYYQLMVMCIIKVSS